MLTLVLVAHLVSSGAGAAALTHSIVPLEPPIAESAIVGRASCRGSTWLLNRSADLIRLTQRTDRPLVRHVRELKAGDPFWGLSCLGDGSLWTLATGHQLARMTPDGEIVERHALLFPQVQLFGVADRLVFLGLPIVARRAILTTSARQTPESVSPWAGLVARAGFGASPDLATNLVACGIGFQSMLPCWFADDERVSISDGVVARSIPVPSLGREGIARAAPIRDVALVAGGAMWILAASSESSNGRRAGGWLFKTDRNGVELASVVVAPSARLIVGADADACVLLTTTGVLMQVSGARERIR